MKTIEGSLSIDLLAEHYAKRAALLESEGLGMLNAAEKPIPRKARFAREGMESYLRDGYGGFETALPNALAGCDVLLVGCGSGRDAFVLSELVGGDGSVTAIDSSADEIAKAEVLLDKLKGERGGNRPSITFERGFPERLDALGLENESFDCVITNYFFNLAFDRHAVLREFYRVLRQGGELYLGALFTDRRLMPPLLADSRLRHPVVRGAVYLEDFRRWMRDVGWEVFRYTQKRRVVLEDLKEQELLKEADLIYRVIRTFKLGELEDLCENYGQSLEYLGEMPDYNQFFDLDDRHRFFIDKPVRVCGNTCAFIEQTRFAPYFRREGNRTDRHFGLYEYCWYCGMAKEEDDIIEYSENGKEVCADCSHRAFCIVDGHCQHEG